MKNLKAYKVFDSKSNCGCAIAFAYDKNKAKSIWLCDDQFLYSPYIDLRATRIPKADYYIDKSNIQKPCGINFGCDVHLFRNVLGWYEFGKIECASCEKTDYEEDKYSVCDGCCYCKECGCCC